MSTPSFKLKLYQEPVVEHLCRVLTDRHAAIDCSEAGVGKTYSAIATAARLNLPVIVACPKIMIPVWARIAKNAGVPATVINYERVNRRAKDFFSKFPSWSKLVIFDEAHRCKGVKSKNSKLMITAFNCQKVLALSATLAINPLEMAAIGYGLKLHCGKDFYAWCKRMGCVPGFWGGLVFNPKTKEKYLLALHSQLFPAHGVRLKRADIPGFPETQITAEAYDCGEPVSGVYDDLRLELQALEIREQQAYERAVAKEDLGQESGQAFITLSYARQKAELLKVPTFVDLAKLAVEKGESAVIFVNHKATANLILNQLAFSDYKVGKIDGDSSPEHRALTIDLFQTDQIRIFICTIATGGASISLHDENGKYPRCSFISPVYSVIELVQALGRIHRSGGKSLARQTIVYAAGTVEERVCDRVRDKLHDLTLLHDGDLQEPIL